MAGFQYARWTSKTARCRVLAGVFLKSVALEQSINDQREMNVYLTTLVATHSLIRFIVSSFYLIRLAIRIHSYAVASRITIMQNCVTKVLVEQHFGM
jgi:hypothetical protein